MNQHDANIPGEPQDGFDADAQYELWYDGLLEGAAAERMRRLVGSDERLRARHAADLAIDAGLRRSFGAPQVAGARAFATAQGGHGRVPWASYATAASVLALFGATLAVTLAPHGARPETSAPLARNQRPVLSVPKSPIAHSFAATPVNNAVRSMRSSALGDVFLDALALEFQPRLGCQMLDAWEAELYTQLAAAPCSLDEDVVVLGEWLDPRLDVASMVMLRRGENPIMLVVPRCEVETDLCVSKDSGLYLHRGTRDGRTIYELSPAPGSEILSCVQAQSVVTQQQL
jgi:hypothetical protein